MSRREDRSRARRWLAGLVLALGGGAAGWVFYTRWRGQQTLAADPWATPARPPAAEAAAVPAEEPEPASTPDVPEPAEPASPAAPGEGPYGAGSAAPLPDGSAPEGFAIKGNASSMLYHPSDSPYHGRTKAGVWFRDEASAEAAGFQRWDHKRRG